MSLSSLERKWGLAKAWLDAAGSHVMDFMQASCRLKKGEHSRIEFYAAPAE
jgi:hypothetical protein